MSKYFRFHMQNSTRFRCQEDINKIRAYLDSVGDLNCTDEELLIFWRVFSDSWDASWLHPTDGSEGTLPPFAQWLADYGTDDYDEKNEEVDE